MWRFDAALEELKAERAVSGGMELAYRRRFLKWEGPTQPSGGVSNRSREVEDLRSELKVECTRGYGEGCSESRELALGYNIRWGCG
jgi:hypothetical protein